jgi:putative peptidoglycan lipid II flippase
MDEAGSAPVADSHAMAEPTRDTPAKHVGGGIAVAALIIMAGNVLSRLLGLGREQLAAGLFGTGDHIAAFTIADNIQTLLFDLMVSGALEAALIPVFAQWAAPDAATRRALRRISGALLLLVIIVLGSAAAIGIIFAPAVVDGLIWFSRTPDARAPGTVALTIHLVRIVLPAAALLGVGAVMQAMLYGMGKVTAPALATTARNLAIVIAMTLLASAIGVRSMAWGTVAGAVLVIVLQLVPLIRAGAMPRLNLGFRHPALRQMFALYIPVFFGLLFSTLAVIVDRGLAWGAGQDAVGAMRYATTLVQLVLGLVAAAISLAALPTLARHYGNRDEREYKATLGRALGMVTFLIFPATFGLAALAYPIANLLFGHGATDQHGVRQIALALVFYLPGTLAAAYDQVLIFAFYARLNTRLPVLIGIAAIGVYFAVALSLVGRFGMVGLVLANSAQFIAHTIMIWYAARRAFGWHAETRLRTLIPRCALASLLMATTAALLWLALDRALPTMTGSRHVLRALSVVALPVLTGAAIYLALIARTSSQELALLKNAFGQKLARLRG